MPDHYRDPYRGAVADGRVTADHASFYAMIACIDENLARLDWFLHQNGLYDDTIFVFMTDNGTASGEAVYNAGMRGRKSSIYDGGHRVPCLLRWPGGGIGGMRAGDARRRRGSRPPATAIPVSRAAGGRRCERPDGRGRHDRRRLRSNRRRRRIRRHRELGRRRRAARRARRDTT